MNEIKFTMPPGVVSAIERGASAAEACGYPNIQASIIDGKVTHLSLFDRDGRQHFVVPSGKGWIEYVDVDG